MTKEDIEKFEKDGNLPNENYVCCTDLSTDDHLSPVNIFQNYACLSCSKTFIFDENATVDDIKDFYMRSYNTHVIKGITVYRNNSRNQPIFIENKNNNELYVSKKVRKRKNIMSGLNTKGMTPYGSIFLNLVLDEQNEPFETFLSLGKSGSLISSLLESIGRLISISLRSNTDIRDIINTLKYINESEVWSRDTFDGDVQKICSIPDHIAHILEDMMNHLDKNNLNNNIVESNTIIEDLEDIININKKNICPNCHSLLIISEGCPRCPVCNWSKCG
jgi:ribonucleoside-diphosphate reductase alpha chain